MKQCHSNRTRFFYSIQDLLPNKMTAILKYILIHKNFTAFCPFARSFHRGIASPCFNIFHLCPANKAFIWVSSNLYNVCEPVWKDLVKARCLTGLLRCKQWHRRLFYQVGGVFFRNACDSPNNFLWKSQLCQHPAVLCVVKYLTVDMTLWSQQGF